MKFRPGLQKASPGVYTLISAVAAFCVYTCMYAFRKPFTAANYGSLQFLHIDYKIWLVIAQTIGYTGSKFFGIRFIAEVKKKNRFPFIIINIGIAWSALFFFALVPAPYNIIFLLLNGFPLGVIYGLVFSYLEGRKTTEFLGAVLSASFIFASGFTQSAGKYILLEWHTGTWWMPFITGLLFFPPLLLFAWLLEQTPAPSQQDMELRTERKMMNRKERRQFIRAFYPGLVLLIITYVLLTVIRDYRSNFAADIWNELGLGNDTAVFTRSELIPSVTVLLIMSLMIMIRNNIRALFINHTLVIIGFFIAMVSTILFSAHWVSPFWWMTLTGTGLYLGYVPFNCMLFERLIASFKYVSTAGFIIYVADSFGYLGSDIILLVKNFSGMSMSWTNFFIQMIMILSVMGILLTFFSVLYFKKRYQLQFSDPLNMKYA
ncbi:MAG: hypothetical protein GC171_09705 [Terrimonas sp.]|nr:hypothetical protein [Terrimonas sp.]